MSDAKLVVDVVLNMVDKTIAQLSANMKSEATKVSKHLEGLTITGPIEKELVSNTQDAMKTLMGYGNTLQQVEKTYGKTSEKAREYSKQLKAIGVDVKAARRATQGFNFDFLSLIFGGMALKRIFGGAFKSIMSGYKEIADKNNHFVELIGDVGGAFEFLKFTIADAFANSPIVQGALELFESSLIKLAEFMDNHPNFSVTLMTIIGALATFGTVMFAAGTVKQITDVGGSLTAFAKTLRDNKSLFLKGAQIGISAYFAYDSIKKFQEGDILGSIADALIAGGVLLVTKMPFAGGVILAIGTTLKLIDVFKDKESREQFTSARDQIQTLFDELGDMSKKLSLKDFNSVFKTALENIDSDILNQQMEDIQFSFSHGLIDEESFRKQVSLLLGTVESDIETTTPLDNIFDISEDASGLSDFSIMALNSVDSLSSNMKTSITTSMKSSFDTMEENFKTSFTYIDKKQFSSKTIDIYYIHHNKNGEDDEFQTPATITTEEEPQ